MSIFRKAFNLFVLTLTFLFLGCSSVDYKKTVDSLDINRFMGKWYVVAGRTTFVEKGAHNSLEEYIWNDKENRIDINFTFNKNSFTGKKKTVTQKGWIENKQTNAHWLVQPFWPLKLDYLVLALDPEYEWTIVGVSSQSYVWIMTRDPNPKQKLITKLIKKVEELNYNSEDIKLIPQKW